MASFLVVTTLSSSPWGGSEELWAETAGALLERGHRVAVSGAWSPAPYPRWSDLRDAGAEISFRRGGQWQSPDGVVLNPGRGRAEGIDRVDPDLVLIAQGDPVSGLPWARACREAGRKAGRKAGREAGRDRPYVLLTQMAATDLWPRDETLDRLREAYLGARAVLFVCRANLDLVRTQLAEPLPMARVISNAYQVDPGRGPLLPPKSTGGFALASVARLDPSYKGQDVLVDVLARPRWRERDVSLTFCGEGRTARGLRRLVDLEGLERVRFAGHVTPVESIWECHDLLVLPSRHEGSPLALIEAGLCGRPVVATGVGGIPELVEDGETGFLSASTQADDFDHALERAWRRREQLPAMGARLRERLLERISPAPGADLARLLETLRGPVLTT